MKKILEGLEIAAVGTLGCAVYLVFSFIGAVITIIIIGGLFNLIF
jgi:hypothetical protein